MIGSVFNSFIGIKTDISYETHFIGSFLNIISQSFWGLLCLE